MNTTAQSATGSQAAKLWDSIIIGGGAAGLSAGVVLARARFATLVVDGGEPRNGPADHMHGYLTQDGTAPKEFLATGRSELSRYGGMLVQASVVDARRTSDGTFELRLDDGSAPRARSLLVATGLTDELPDVPGLSDRWASTVHHCPHCHGYEVGGRDIAVIGNPATAMTSAVSVHVAALMRRYSSTVTFCINGADVDTVERQRLTAYGVGLIDAQVARVASPAGTAGDDSVEIELHDGETVACEAIFVTPRPVPLDSILTILDAGTDPASGLVAVDSQGATNVPGLWAAGNVVNPRAQVITAAGAGSTTAINITGWLLEQELSAAAARDGLDDRGIS